MYVSLKCPECAHGFAVTETAAQQLVRCPRCQCPVEPKRVEEAIQTRPASAPRPHEDEEPAPMRRRREPSPRSPFPWSALLIVAIGLLFFLLAFSVGFNVWFISQPENQIFRRNDAAVRAEREAQMRIQAEQEAVRARRELEATREELQKLKAQMNAK